MASFVPLIFHNFRFINLTALIYSYFLMVAVQQHLFGMIAKCYTRLLTSIVLLSLFNWVIRFLQFLIYIFLHLLLIMRIHILTCWPLFLNISLNYCCCFLKLCVRFWGATSMHAWVLPIMRLRSMRWGAMREGEQQILHKMHVVRYCFSKCLPTFFKC